MTYQTNQASKFFPFWALSRSAVKGRHSCPGLPAQVDWRMPSTARSSPGRRLRVFLGMIRSLGQMEKEDGTWVFFLGNMSERPPHIKSQDLTPLHLKSPAKGKGFNVLEQKAFSVESWLVPPTPRHHPCHPGILGWIQKEYWKYAKCVLGNMAVRPQRKEMEVGLQQHLIPPAKDLWNKKLVQLKAEVLFGMHL